MGHKKTVNIRDISDFLRNFRINIARSKILPKLLFYYSLFIISCESMIIMLLEIIQQYDPLKFTVLIGLILFAGFFCYKASQVEL